MSGAATGDCDSGRGDNRECPKDDKEEGPLGLGVTTGLSPGQWWQRGEAPKLVVTSVVPLSQG